MSVAHLKERGTRAFIERLKGEGLDAVETRHPSHDPDLRARLTDITLQLGLLRTGGSDWHGDPEPGVTHGTIGSQAVPIEWLDRLARVPRRASPPARLHDSSQPGSLAPDFTAAASDGGRTIFAGSSTSPGCCWCFIPGNNTPG